jgi:hypothetical protein
MSLPEIEKRITINISYQMVHHSFYAELNELDKSEADKIGYQVMTALESACEARLKQLKKDQ